MLESVEFENLRGVRSGKVEGLAAINVVVGPNNSGKTTLLEAIALLRAPEDLAGTIAMLLARGGAAHRALRAVAHDGAQPVTVLARRVRDGATVDHRVQFAYDATRPADHLRLAISQGFSEPLEFYGTQGTLDGSGGAVRAVIDQNGRVGPPWLLTGRAPAAAVRFIELRRSVALEDALSDVERANAIPEVVAALSTALTGLTGLLILKVDADFVAHARFSEGPPIPVYLLGDGAKRLLLLAAGIFAQPGETVLLEEPEAFQHPRYVREIARLLVAFAARGAQYISTTHSIEFLDLLFEELAKVGAPPSLAVHRTRLVDGELRVTTLDGERARRLRHDLLEDLRG